MLAKQAASIDVLSGGRLELGIGAGWLAEEFEALAVPFDSRSERLTEWVTVLRACWTGARPQITGRHYRLRPDCCPGGRPGTRSRCCSAVIRPWHSRERVGQIAAAPPALAEAGISEIIVDSDWAVPGSPAATFDVLSGATGRTTRR